MEANGHKIEKGANLEGANLSNVNLYQADLTGANLEGATLTDANLHGIDLSDAYISDAILGETRKEQKPDDDQLFSWRYDETADEHVRYSGWETDEFGRTMETDEDGLQCWLDD